MRSIALRGAELPFHFQNTVRLDDCSRGRLHELESYSSTPLKSGWIIHLCSVMLVQKVRYDCRKAKRDVVRTSKTNGVEQNCSLPSGLQSSPASDYIVEGQALSLSVTAIESFSSWTYGFHSTVKSVHETAHSSKNQLMMCWIHLCQYQCSHWYQPRAELRRLYVGLRRVCRLPTS